MPSKVSFEIAGRRFTAYGPDQELVSVATKDVLLNRSYEYLPKFEIQNFKGGVVIDAGAHVGLFSIIASVFADRVVSIEPHPVNVRFLQQNLRINKVQNVAVLPRCLWSRNGKVRLYEAKGSVGSSILMLSKTSHEVDTITLRDLIRNLGSINLLKMDIEGAEFAVFETIDSNVLSNIQAITGEFHISQGRLQPILDKLQTAGFTTSWFSPPVYRGKFKYEMRVFGSVRVKMWRMAAYTIASLLSLRDTGRCMLFAYK